jgi:uncharacterized radical SAM protein YgiQ
VSRGEESILGEIRLLAHHPDFRGTISDIGGPSANTYGIGGRDPRICGLCRRPSCLFPGVCPNLSLSFTAQTRLLRRALEAPGVKHVHVASGIRYDLLMDATGEKPRPEAREYFSLLVENLVGGHLSVAPEHVSPRVLRWMRKPSFKVFRAFSRLFAEWSARAGKEQYLIPYFIASFPGCTEADMEQVKTFLKEAGRRLQQVQDFLPGPMTLAGAMYHAEMEPKSFQPIHVAKTDAERRRQREILLYHQTETAAARRVPSRVGHMRGAPPARPARAKRPAQARGHSRNPDAKKKS